jgi:hypothetical protein
LRSNSTSIAAEYLGSNVNQIKVHIINIMFQLYERMRRRRGRYAVSRKVLHKIRSKPFIKYRPQISACYYLQLEAKPYKR